MSKAPSTQVDAYRRFVDEEEDVDVQREVALVLYDADDGMTGEEMAQHFPDRKPTSVIPRLTELVQTGYAERTGRRANESTGNGALVHVLTEKGEKFARGETKGPERPIETESAKKTEVVDMARRFCRGEVDEDMLRLALEVHDDFKRRMDPEWEPE